MSEPDYVVIRAAADLPPGFMPPSMEGKWFDRADMPWAHSIVQEAAFGAVAIPTGRFEVREDGAVAEVWEMRP